MTSHLEELHAKRVEQQAKDQERAAAVESAKEVLRAQLDPDATNPSANAFADAVAVALLGNS